MSIVVTLMTNAFLNVFVNPLFNLSAAGNEGIQYRIPNLVNS
jgi:hypothetical protein